MILCLLDPPELRLYISEI